MTHFLYAMASAASAPPFCSYLKIGHASSPLRRVKDHQIGSPLPLQLVGLWSMKLRNTAVRLETRCHHRFIDRCIHGEWHQIEVSALESFVALVAREEGFGLWSVDPSTLQPMEFLTLRSEERHAA